MKDVKKLIIINQVIAALVLIPRFISSLLGGIKLLGISTVEAQGTVIILLGLSAIYLISFFGIAFRQRWAAIIAVIIGVIDLINVYKLFDSHGMIVGLGAIVSDIILIWTAGYLSRTLIRGAAK